MIRLRKKYRLEVSDRLAATAAMLLFVSSITAPIGPLANNPTAQIAANSSETVTAEQAQTQKDSVLEGAVAELASAVSKSGSKALNISSLIFRF